MVASRYGVQCQGCDELALTLFDVLDYMEEVPVVAQYKLADGTVTDRFPTGKTLDDAQPVVIKLPGWHCDITSVRKYEDLPEGCPRLCGISGKGRWLQDQVYLRWPGARCLHHS